ncbi:MAG: hypothetical protein K2Y13_16645 [Burkholderiaceae bacterium]|uniref:Uncharacterized protein n=1 Tax=Herminiimonas contaminans TaxID=1111140 RepID=A0ABS0EQ49_9BURK|nr:MULTISPECIES: hypothetical protein [Oxalobacteraceae]MBF8176914.1 hypothetical protein [Herminiimonas contaminans]MBX9801085.1 hypothetical protein [Burkholderiaceae bacterium]
MTRINLDNIAALQNTFTQYRKTPSTQFADVLGTTANNNVQIAQSLSAVTPVGATNSANFATDLSNALKAYGINVPPVLRVTAGANGYELSGDPRNTQFKKMLADHPSLSSGFDGAIGSATMGRDAALKSAMNAFAGDHPSSSVKKFLKDFEDAQDPKALSVKFDGQDLKVEELTDKGWGPVKTEESFMAALLEAYAKYMLTQGVSLDNDKDKKEDEQTVDKKAEQQSVATS